MQLNTSQVCPSVFDNFCGTSPTEYKGLERSQQGLLHSRQNISWRSHAFSEIISFASRAEKIKNKKEFLYRFPYNSSLHTQKENLL